MVSDMLRLAQKLEKELVQSSPIMQSLRPSLTLVGSVAEGTRIGLGCEIDLSMKFDGLEPHDPSDAAFTFKEDDPFHLYEGPNAPQCLNWYFEVRDQYKSCGRDPRGRTFQLDRFKQDLLDLVDCGLMNIFLRGENPPRLKIKQHNNHSRDHHECLGCKELVTKGSSMQCQNCMYMTSQTKLGICLQFLWISGSGQQEAYCSVDLIPVFR